MLRFIEAVNFVNEKNGGFVAQFLPSIGLFDFSANLGDIRLYTIERLEAGAGAASNDGGEGGLAGSRRAVEDEGGEAVALDGAAEELAFGEDMLLSSHFGEVARTHASCKWLVAWLTNRPRRGLVGEEIGHLFGESLEFDI